MYNNLIKLIQQYICTYIELWNAIKEIKYILVVFNKKLVVFATKI